MGELHQRLLAFGIQRQSEICAMFGTDCGLVVSGQTLAC